MMKRRLMKRKKKRRETKTKTKTNYCQSWSYSKKYPSQ